jgi:hypothetical protein
MCVLHACIDIGDDDSVCAGTEIVPRRIRLDARRAPERPIQPHRIVWRTNRRNMADVVRLHIEDISVESERSRRRAHVGVAGKAQHLDVEGGESLQSLSGVPRAN